MPLVGVGQTNTGSVRDNVVIQFETQRPTMWDWGAGPDDCPYVACLPHPRTPCAPARAACPNYPASWVAGQAWLQAPATRAVGSPTCEVKTAIASACDKTSRISVSLSSDATASRYIKSLIPRYPPTPNLKNYAIKRGEQLRIIDLEAPDFVLHKWLSESFACPFLSRQCRSPSYS